MTAVDETRARAAALEQAAAGALLGAAEVMAILGIQKSRYYELDRAGELDGLKVRPQLGPRCFSSAKILRYLAGEPMPTKKELKKLRER